MDRWLIPIPCKLLTLWGARRDPRPRDCLRRSVTCRFHVARDANLPRLPQTIATPWHAGFEYAKAVGVARFFRGQSYATTVEVVERHNRSLHGCVLDND
jgi:hypothetical protein